MRPISTQASGPAINIDTRAPRQRAGAARGISPEEAVSVALRQLEAADATRRSSPELFIVPPGPFSSSPVSGAGHSSPHSTEAGINPHPSEANTPSQLAPFVVLLSIGFTMFAFAAGFWLGRFVD
ncbi:MAG: hypothetical protein HZB13_12695 [Acidobacteria bacterium]|nr:hypothetical protein [Acidobacteriota bacterium]